MNSVNDDPFDWPDPKPRLVLAPDFDSLDDAEDAIELAASAGLVLDDWQKATLRLMMARRNGRFAAFEMGLMVGRQNGKGSILEARELAGLFLLGDKRIIHTSHRQETSLSHFKRIKRLIEGNRDLERYVKSIISSNGKEGIYFKDGREMIFRTRYSGGGRGLPDTGLLVFDEAMVLQHSSVADLMDTMTVAPDPQAIYTGTAGKDGDPDSVVFGALRDRALAGDNRRFAWVEWTGAEPDDHTGENVNLDDRKAWRRGNPSPRVSDTFIEAERNSAAMGEEEFGRERLCLWWTGRRIALVHPDTWKGLEGDAPVSKRVAFAVDIPPERDSASIAVASDLGDGRRAWELVDRRSGTAWVVDRVVDLWGKWKPSYVAVAPSSPAGAKIDEISEALERRRVEILRVRGDELKAACGQFLDKIRDQLVVVQPNYEAELAAAVDALRKREYEDGGFSFIRKDAAADISPAMALVLASYAVGKPQNKGGSWSAGSKTPCKCGCGVLTETGFATKACKRRFEESDAA